MLELMLFLHLHVYGYKVVFYLKKPKYSHQFKDQAEENG